MGDEHHPLRALMAITSIEAVRYSKPGQGAPWVIKAEPGFTLGLSAFLDSALPVRRLHLHRSALA